MLVNQTVFSSPGVRGNCTRAAVATLLGLPLWQVPMFELHPHQFPVMRDFFADLGFDLVTYEPARFMTGLTLVCGKSVRGNYHMVVYEGDRLFHDPHPSRAGLVEVDWSHSIIPHYPTVFAGGHHYAHPE